MSTLHRYGVCIPTCLLKNPQAKTLVFDLDFAQPKGSNPSPAIPWEDIVGSPDVYFDTAIYKLPCALKSPEQLKESEPFYIIALYQYFSAISASQPFQFRSREASCNGSLSSPPVAVNTPVVQNPGSNSTTHQRDTLPASSASLALPAPSMEHTTSPVMTVSAQSVTTAAAAMVPPAQPAKTTTTATPPQLEETLPVALSLPRTTQVPAEAQSVSGSAAGPGVIVSEEGSAGVSALPLIPQKKGKASKKSKHTTAAKRAKGDAVVGDTGSTPSRQASTRTIDLKRKKVDAETLDTQPPKKKKTMLKDRWVYVTEEPQTSATS